MCVVIVDRIIKGIGNPVIAVIDWEIISFILLIEKVRERTPRDHMSLDYRIFIYKGDEQLFNVQRKKIPLSIRAYVNVK